MLRTLTAAALAGAMILAAAVPASAGSRSGSYGGENYYNGTTYVGPGSGYYNQGGPYGQPYSDPYYRRVDDRYGYGSGYDNRYANNPCYDEWSNDRVVGTLLGAILGGVIGGQFGKGSGRDAAAIAGVLIGGFAGNRIAGNMDCQDQWYAQDTYYDAYEYGRPGQRYDWRNPNSGNYGYIEPSGWYQDRGQDCREYTQTIYIDGRRQTATGIACRNHDGSWRIVQ